jgi:hypothetical protein
MPSLPESISQGPTAPSRPLDPDPTRVWRIRSDDEALAGYEDFVDLVVPELQDRGVYKTAYAEGSLRRKLFDAGDRLPARHAAAQFRHQAALVPTAQ